MYFPINMGKVVDIPLLWEYNKHNSIIMGRTKEVYIMYCPNCGEQIDDKAVICPKCGVPVKSNASSAADDAPSTGFAVLGFFFPLIGLILYLVWKSDRPLRAQSAGKGALIGFIVSIVFSIIYAIVVGAIIGSAIGNYAISLLFLK